MSVSIGVVGAGQFAESFLPLFKLHPAVGSVYVTDVVAERAADAETRFGLDGTFESFQAMLESDCDAVAIFTQRWTHGPLVLEALEAGKHVYSCVPMATTEEEIAAIVSAVVSSGRTYMMGETSYYYPAAVYGRQRRDAGDFGRIFYAEGDYVHDMDLGFYAAYQFSGGDRWKETASYPPMLYPTHAIGGVLSVLPGHAISVSCLGVKDDRGDGVFDRSVSMFDNDISNATGLFELSDGAVMRTNEMRRVGYPSHIRESRYRYFGTGASFEQLAEVSVWQTKEGVTDVSDLLEVRKELDGGARVHDRSRLPASYAGIRSGHEGSHHFLADDFVTAVVTGSLPPVNAWVAARYTLPGIVAHRSALAGGQRLAIPDLGEPPA
ncbi:MAG: Gfo/Idh/MocA family protein [Acidimicrobiales bacterium]